MAWLAPVEGLSATGSVCRRIPVAPGVEVLMDEQHPALRLNRDPAVIAEALRQALASVTGVESSPAPVELPDLAASAWTSTLAEAEMFDESALGSEHSE
jgi:hypothetical protein